MEQRKKSQARQVGGEGNEENTCLSKALLRLRDGDHVTKRFNALAFGKRETGNPAFCVQTFLVWK